MGYLQPADLTPFASIDDAKAKAMINDAEATAIMLAPCLSDAEFSADPARAAYVKAVLRAAVLRWHESGTGAFQTQTAGPFSVGMDTRQQRRGMFWPSEIQQLQDACKHFRGENAQTAFVVDRLGGHRRRHLPWCDLMFGGASCSCGVSLTRGAPIFEGGYDL